MKKFIPIWVWVACMAACTVAKKQTYSYNKPIIVDAGSNRAKLLGLWPQSSLSEPPFNTWYTTAWNTYKVDTSVITNLQAHLKNIKVQIFMGTWCGDSKREVPKMLRLLHEIKFDTSALQIIMVDNADTAYKASPDHAESGKYIFRVPTFIFYENDKELNRIVETPVISMEMDMLNILQKNRYVPQYRAAQYWLKLKTNTNKYWTISKLKKTVIAMQPLSKSQSELYSLAMVCNAQGNSKQAINLLTLNTLLYPNHINSLETLAVFFEQQNKNAKAIYWYQKALEKKPNDEQLILKIRKLKT
jgi:tetratricopeptide (TPR) repeat protein